MGADDRTGPLCAPWHPYMDISALYAFLAGSISGAVVGTVAGRLAARAVHHSIVLEVADMLEKISWLYDRVRKRTKINGDAADVPAVEVTRPRTNADISRLLEARRREQGGR